MKVSWHSPVSAVVVALIALTAPGCTERNPRYCGDGVCIDPAFPFCDVDGMFGELKQQCVAVDCTPGDFAACRSDEELRCNATGTNYTSTRCELGCDASGGCRLCEPGQTTCTNGQVATCDAAGNVVASESCPLGCFQDEARCSELDPSNGLAQYLERVADPPAVDLENALIDTGTGTITTPTGTIALPQFTALDGTGLAIRVFVAKSVRLKNVSAYSLGDPDQVSGPALAFVARGEIVVEGRVRIVGTAGGVKAASCRGGVGTYFETGSSFRATGSGGGGHATAGAAGGSIGVSPGGTAGAPAGTDSLIPLRGGCPAGGVDIAGGPIVLYGAAGGGALQLSSGTSIRIAGTINVSGLHGDIDQAGIGASVSGGGAGGGILLEAPSVELGPQAKLIAKGGGGASYGPSVVDDDTAAPSPGTPCDGTCADGGNGAAPGFPAMAGEQCPTTVGDMLSAGGGGGGMGRVRVNTLDATYSKSSSAVEAALITTGILRVH